MEKQKDSDELRKEALPHLQELAQKTVERINLGILFQGEVLYLGGIVKSLPMVYTRFGKKAPVHCCSLGKDMLAYLPEPEMDRILIQKPLIKMTENTITDLRAFKKQLAEIRSRGYAIDCGEHIAGSYCISALIRDTTVTGIASISISSGSLEKVKGYLELLLQTAEVVSHLMGYPSAVASSGSVRRRADSVTGRLPAGAWLRCSTTGGHVLVAPSSPRRSRLTRASYPAGSGRRAARASTG